MELSEGIYTLTASFPKHEIYGLSSQMRRAAVSIPSNIAEGSARASKKDFRHFILTAKGSACELQTQLLLAGRLSYLSEADLLSAEATIERIARMLSGLAQSLKASPDNIPNVSTQHKHLEPRT